MLLLHTHIHWHAWEKRKKREKNRECTHLTVFRAKSTTSRTHLKKMRFLFIFSGS
jgi:hypothetical protein